MMSVAGRADGSAPLALTAIERFAQVYDANLGARHTGGMTAEQFARHVLSEGMMTEAQSGLMRRLVFALLMELLAENKEFRQSGNSALQLLREANELLRSAYQIASRLGAETNWQAFQNQLTNALSKQHAFLFPTISHTADIITEATGAPAGGNAQGVLSTAPGAGVVSQEFSSEDSDSTRSGGNTVAGAEAPEDSAEAPAASPSSLISTEACS